MFNLIKKWLLLMGVIYLASLVVNNVTFESGFTTMAVLSLLINIAQLLFKPIKKMLLSSLDKACFGLPGFIFDVFLVCFIAFLYNQVRFVPFDSSALPHSLAGLPKLSLSGFWSLLPFSTIIGIIARLLIKSSKS